MNKILSTAILLFILLSSSRAFAFWLFDRSLEEVDKAKVNIQEKVNKKISKYNKNYRIKQKKKKDLEKQRQDALKEVLKINEEEAYLLTKYNVSAGSNELDFFGIYGKRQINTKGVISPDFSKLAYSEVHLYPSIMQLTSKIFIIPLSQQKRVIRRILDANVKNRKTIKFYESGMSAIEEEVFRTLTIVDWSDDSNKLLVKERIAENLRGFIGTNIWVYDFSNEKNYFLNNIRGEIQKYWREKGFEINKYRWDIQPIGWFKYQKDRVLVEVYVYKKDGAKVYLGSWLLGYKDGSVLRLGKNKNYPVNKNGLVLKRKKNF